MYSIGTRPLMDESHYRVPYNATSQHSQDGRPLSVAQTKAVTKSATANAVVKTVQRQADRAIRLTSGQRKTVTGRGSQPKRRG